MSMDVYLKEEARIAWQVNDTSWSVICGETAPPNNLANTWTHKTGKNTITVPVSGDRGKMLYLSGMQLGGAEAYIANFVITITEKP